MKPIRLQIVAGDRVLAESFGRRLALGRGRANDVRFEDRRISSLHGEIALTTCGFVYRDLGSRNGSCVRRGASVLPVDESNGRQVELLDADELILGGVDDPAAQLDLVIREVDLPGQNGRGVPRRTITTTLHVDRIEGLARRVEDDKSALLCLYRLLTRLNGVHERDQFVATVADLILESFPDSGKVELFLRDDSSQLGLAGARSRDPAAEAATGALSRTLLEHVQNRREAILFEEAEGVAVEADGAAGRSRVSMLAPLWDRKEIGGLVRVESRLPQSGFRDRDLELLTLMANHAALVLSNLDLTSRLLRLNEQLSDALRRIELLNLAKQHLAKFAPETVRRLVEERPEHPHLTQLDADASVLFLDIGGYTKLTEALDRDKVSFLVERYFSAFIDDIYAHGGDINETAGDGLMIIFRSADRHAHARSAVRAAVAIRRQTRCVNAELKGFDPIDVNMGVNSGMVTIGSRKIQGVAGTRWTYTATGMVTNLAARFGAHAVRGQIIIGPDTAERVHDEFTLRALGPVALKNVSKPVSVYEVLDPADWEETVPVRTNGLP